MSNFFIKYWIWPVAPLLALAAVINAKPDTSEQAVKLQKQPVVVAINRIKCSQHKLSLDWAITNSDVVPNYIYSTFLKTRAVDKVFDPVSHVFTIWTTMRQEANYSVSDYPNREFVKLLPGEAMKGRFHEHDPLYRNPKGAINMVFAVAFGRSLQSLNAEFQEGKYSHPANPIVHWQKIALSAPVSIPGCIAK